MENERGNSEITRFEEILRQNNDLWRVLKNAALLKMPNYYLAAGCVSQTVWNAQHGYDLSHGINDYDLIYYDSGNIASEGQNFYIEKGKELFKDISMTVEIVNQARVHLWFEDRFRFQIKQYVSSEDAIDSWAAAASCIGVRLEDKN